MYELGLRGHLSSFIQNFLVNRRIEVEIGSTFSNAMGVDEGVPQRSVFSCTLFAIAIDGVVANLETTQVRSALYVDDLAIYASGTMRAAEHQIQAAITKLQQLSRESGLQFSAGKTVSMHICRAREEGVWCSKTAPETEPLNGTPISCK